MVRRKAEAYLGTNKKAVAAAARKLMFNNKTPNSSFLSVSSYESTPLTNSVGSSVFDPTPVKPGNRPSLANKSLPRKKTPKKLPRKSLTNKSPNTSKGNDSTLRKHRYRPGTAALMQIKRLQKTTNLLIPRLSFCRVVKEIMNELTPPGRESYRIQSLALTALQEMTELYFAHFFEDALLCTLHARRVTLHPKDIHLARRIRGRADPIN